MNHTLCVAFDKRIRSGALHRHTIAASITSVKVKTTGPSEAHTQKQLSTTQLSNQFVHYCSNPTVRHICIAQGSVWDLTYVSGSHSNFKRPGEDS